MAIAFEKVLKTLPAAERAAIETRARMLVAEYLALRDRRSARRLTRKTSAEPRGKC